MTGLLFPQLEFEVLSPVCGLLALRLASVPATKPRLGRFSGRRTRLQTAGQFIEELNDFAPEPGLSPRVTLVIRFIE
jgi:hypothetical protein